MEIKNFSGKRVLIIAEKQLSVALAMVELDGVAGRLAFWPPDLNFSHLQDVILQAGIDIILLDSTVKIPEGVAGIRTAELGLNIARTGRRPTQNIKTEWLLFTSGTTGRPKMVVHTLQSLAGPVADGFLQNGAVWTTFYDIRRYGGLQILLRALLGGGSMVFSDTHESMSEFLLRAGASSVTHISGTPSHWRLALMSSMFAKLSPSYIRLSGEVADQTILDRLRRAFPDAGIAHAFASTEAGVAFDVRDGLAGFPADFIDEKNGKIQMRVQDGCLQIRSSRIASYYAGNAAKRIKDEEGFVDTGDMVELRDGRYYFIGRREGVINVGGLKVHPEEVEALVNSHPSVQMSLVQGRPSPVTGAIVVADIVLKPGDAGAAETFDRIKEEILNICRRALPAHKVPALVLQVASLNVGSSGKVVRRFA